MTQWVIAEPNAPAKLLSDIFGCWDGRLSMGGGGYGQWSSLPFYLPSLIVHWPARIFILCNCPWLWKWQFFWPAQDKITNNSQGHWNDYSMCNVRAAFKRGQFTFLFWIAKRHGRYDEIAAAILEIGQKNVSDDTIFYFRNYVPKRSHRLPSSMSRTFQKSLNSTRWVWKVLWISLTSQEFFWYMVVRNKRKKPWHIHG